MKSIEGKKVIPGLPPQAEKGSSSIQTPIKRNKKKQQVSPGVVDIVAASDEVLPQEPPSCNAALVVPSLKNLRKKLADIQQLMMKDASTLNSEQLSKISRKAALEEQIALLMMAEKEIVH